MKVFEKKKSTAHGSLLMITVRKRSILLHRKEI